MREMSKGRRLAIMLSASLFVASAYISRPAIAAEGDVVESITLSPVSKRYELKAGDVRNDELTIINDGKAAYDFIAYAKPYSVASDNYSPDFVSEATNGDAYRWVTFDKPKYHLEPGASTKVNFTMTVPKNAAPGGHYGVLFVETQPKAEALSGNAVVRKKRVGAIVYATVQGTYETGGQQDSVDIPFLQLQPPLTVGLRTSNNGNTDFIDTVTVRISDLFGTLKYEDKREYPVLPQTARKMTLEWKQAPSFGLYKVDMTSSFLDQKEASSGYVLMIPGWAIGIIIIVIVGSGLYFVLRRRY